MAHDYKHPGLNNNYLMNSFTNIAITYNDKSVLENYHVSEAFKIILYPINNIFDDLSDEEFKLFRKRFIESILATDMIHHFQSITVIKAKLDHLEIHNGKNVEKILKQTNNSIFSEQQEMINFMVHSADISHNVKSWSISRVWTKLIYEEFFNQGDLEKKE